MRQGVMLELPRERPRDDSGLIDLLDFHFGAGLLPELLQHLAIGAAARRRRHQHLELHGLGVLLEERLGFAEVEGQRAIVFALHP